MLISRADGEVLKKQILAYNELNKNAETSEIYKSDTHIHLLFVEFSADPTTPPKIVLVELTWDMPAEEIVHLDIWTGAAHPGQNKLWKDMAGFLR